jgi:hypothetical protein
MIKVRSRILPTSIRDSIMRGLAFREEIYSRLNELREEKLEERKKHVAAIYFSERIDDQEEDLQVLKQGDDPIKAALDKQADSIRSTEKRIGGMKGANSRLISGMRKIVGGIKQKHGGTAATISKKMAGLDMGMYKRREAAYKGVKTKARNAKAAMQKEEVAVEQTDFFSLDESARSQRRKRNTQKMGRLKVVKVRIRQGKIQRRKKVSAVKGYTVRKGKLTRMTPAERRKRRLGARRGKFKRKSKLNRTRVKLKRSLRRRKSMGL